MPSAESRLRIESPIRVLALVLLLVFTAEGAIMLVLPSLPKEWHDSAASSLLDASALTLLMAPAIWILAISPLRQLFEARGRLLQRLFQTQEQERARIARDLHDSVGQQLTALMVGLRTVEEADDLALARRRAHELRAYAAHAHEEVRRLAHGLGPTILEELGLASAIERLCEDFESSSGLHVALKSDAALAPRLEPGTEMALYRIAQEALSNVVRHAAASRVEVALVRHGRWIQLTIRDDGRGFGADGARATAPEDPGFGLGSIRERALMLGGELTVRTLAGQGTTIGVRIPVSS